MNNLEELIKARDNFNTAASDLRNKLLPFERPINKLLLDKGKKLDSLDLSETIQIANLLISLSDAI